MSCSILKVKLNKGDVMKIHGRCHCRLIEFTAEIDLTLVRNCHCNDC